MSGLLASIAPALRGLSGPRRVLAFGGAAVVLVLLWVLGQWASSPTYAPLYRDLELEQAGAISDRLTKADIPFRLADNGTTVEVPTTDLARARVALAKEGLPRFGRPGLELFDKPSWGMTDFSQRVTYQRALEGELGRSIASIEGIKQAEVHLVLPQASPLRRLERPAEASAVLTLEPGVTLRPETVQAITHLVASSVEQLGSERVAVLDNQGRLLSAPAEEGNASAMTSRELDLQHTVERQLQDKARTLLETVVGPGRARVQVAATLNFDQVDRTVEQYDPEAQVLQSEQRSEAGPADSASGTVVNNAYQNSKRLERVLGAVGGIRRLSAAVLVDEAAARRDAGGQGLDSLWLAQVEQIVRDGIGIDTARGDRISVVALRFEPLATDSAGPAEPPGLFADPVGLFDRFGRPALTLVAMLALALVAWRALGAGRAPEPVLAGLPAGALPAGAPDAAALVPPAAASAAAAMAPLVNANPEVMALRQQALAQSTDSPDAVVSVVRTWLTEAR